MTYENPKEIIRSWGLQGTFSNGPVIMDKLLPVKYGRITTLFLNTWREEQVSNILDWASQSFSIHFPESLQVLASAFLKIELPAISGSVYKDNPGLYAVETFRFLSQGTESYNVDVKQYLRDYLESLPDEHYKVFTQTHLGNTGAAASGAARTLLIPILIPNSAYLNRSGTNTRGRGAWPADTGQYRLEVQITMAPAINCCADANNAPASIAGSISMMYHEVEMGAERLLAYSDARGSYSIVTRRFQEITNGYQAAGANSKQLLQTNQPIGVVTELICIAQPTGTDEAHREIETNVLPVHFALIADSVTQRSLDSKVKVQMELWTNGFVGNSFVNVPGRLCFAVHASESETVYTGGYNMSNSSQITVEVTFDEAVDFRVFAVSLQRIDMNIAGRLSSSIQ